MHLPAKRHYELPRLSPAPWYAGLRYSWRVGPAVWLRKLGRFLLWLWLHVSNPRYTVLVVLVCLGMAVKYPPQVVTQTSSQAVNPEVAGSETKPQNESAPLEPTDPDLVKKYIERYSDIAQSEMRKYGVPASIALAQGIIESRCGTSKMAVAINNHFGMKCFEKHCKKGHCSNFTDDTHKDFFRKYKNPWESWRAHTELLCRGNYKTLHKYGRDYKQWAYGLKSIGYATDRSYAEKLIGVIERYNLHRFD